MFYSPEGKARAGGDNGPTWKIAVLESPKDQGIFDFFDYPATRFDKLQDHLRAKFIIKDPLRDHQIFAARTGRHIYAVYIQGITRIKKYVVVDVQNEMTSPVRITLDPVDYNEKSGTYSFHLRVQVEKPVLSRDEISSGIVTEENISYLENEHSLLISLVSALKDTKDEVRYKAAYALGNIRNPAAVQPLTDALQDKNEEVRYQAVFALGKIKDKRALIPLINMLNDKVEEVRTAAIYSLGNMKDDFAVDYLIAIATDKKESDKLRISALSTLSDMRNIKSIKPIAAVLSDNSEATDVRIEALYVLRWIKGHGSHPMIINALTDNNHIIREKAAIVLGELKDTNAIAPLVGALKDPSRDVRKEAAKALGEYKKYKTVQPLINLLSDNDEDVRGAAAASLVKITGINVRKQENWQKWWDMMKEELLKNSQ